MREADRGLWGSRTAGRALAHVPEGHLHSMDYSAWSEVCVEAAAQGHTLEVVHEDGGGATAYASCRACRCAVWRVERLAVCRAYAGLARPCRPKEQGPEGGTAQNGTHSGPAQ